MLRQRIQTAVVLLVLVLGVLFLAPPPAWGGLLLVGLVIGALEWGRLLPADSTHGRGSAPAVLAGAVGVIGAAWLAWRSNLGGAVPDGMLRVLEILLTAGLVLWLAVAVPSIAHARARAARSWFAVVALLALFVALVELRFIGPWHVLSSMAIIWLADIGAYFCGRAFGRRKLAPRISPGKSWEGAIGGALVAAAVATLVRVVAPTLPVITNDVAGRVGIVPMVLWVVLVAALSVTGDLYESLLKRGRGVKDSGTIFPGHGGMLDRIDALIPTMPVCWLVWLLTR